MTGILAATMANFSMGAPKDPLKPGDFIPSLAKQKRAPRQNRKRSTERLREFFQAQGVIPK